MEEIEKAAALYACHTEEEEQEREKKHASSISAQGMEDEREREKKKRWRRRKRRRRRTENSRESERRVPSPDAKQRRSFIIGGLHSHRTQTITQARGKGEGRKETCMKW